ncbi:Cell wall protein, partial [Lachnellula occidentalis]
MFSSLSSSTLALLLLLLITTQAAAVQVATITITRSAAPTPTSSSYTSDGAFEKDMLDAHNFYREEHNASALSWNESSAGVAGMWAEGCRFVHSGGPTGENLAAGYANASAAVDAWGLERKKYSWKKPGFSEATGHFTQLVWRDTRSVGCGRMSCGGEGG